MIEINIKYKESYDGIGVYNFIRIIKYKHPKKIFRITLKQHIASTFNMRKSDYMKLVADTILNTEREDRTVRDIVLKDIEDKKINEVSRQQIIKEAKWSMKIKGV